MTGMLKSTFLSKIFDESIQNSIKSNGKLTVLELFVSGSPKSQVDLHTFCDYMNYDYVADIV